MASDGIDLNADGGPTAAGGGGPRGEASGAGGVVDDAEGSVDVVVGRIAGEEEEGVGGGAARGEAVGGLGCGVAGKVDGNTEPSGGGVGDREGGEGVGEGTGGGNLVEGVEEGSPAVIGRDLRTVEVEAVEGVSQGDEEVDELGCSGTCEAEPSDSQPMEPVGEDTPPGDRDRPADLEGSLNSNDDNIDNLNTTSNQIESFDSETKTSSSSIKNEQVRGKRKRDAEFQEVIAKAMEDVSAAILRFFDHQREHSSSMLKLMERMVRAEEEKIKERSSRDAEVISILHLLPGLNEADMFRAMQLLQNESMRRQFLSLPDELRLDWLKYNLS